MPKREPQPTSPKPAAAKPKRARKAANKAAPGDPFQNGNSATEEAIRACAYAKWEAAGKPPGEEMKFWLEAEKELGK